MDLVQIGGMWLIIMSYFRFQLIAPCYHRGRRHGFLAVAEKCRDQKESALAKRPLGCDAPTARRHNQLR